MVAQGVVDLLYRGEPSFDHSTFVLLTWNTATEETELPSRKLLTCSDFQIRCRLFAAGEVAVGEAIMAV